jgi:hypothetical protein
VEVTRADVPAAVLAEAIDAVRFAVDPAAPVFGLELAAGLLRTVTSTTGRTAMCTLPAATEGPPVIAAAPAGFVAEAARALRTGPQRLVTVTVGGGRVGIGTLDAPIPPVPPPDYSPYLLHRPASGAWTDVSALRDQLPRARTRPLPPRPRGAARAAAIIVLDPRDGTQRVDTVDDETLTSNLWLRAIDIEYLTQAFAAAGPGPVFWQSEKSTNPVLIRPGGGADRLFIVSGEILPAPPR